MAFVEKVEDLKFPLTHNKLIDNRAFSDMDFVVEKNRHVSAHIAIILSRAASLVPAKNRDILKKEMAKPLAKRKIQEVVFREGPSYNCLLNVLKWVYTDSVEFTKLSIADVLELNGTALTFQLTRLNWLCEKYLHSILKMDNLFEILKGAHTDQKQSAVKGYALNFAIKNYNDFITNKEGIHALGIDLFQEVVTKYTSGVDQPAEPGQEPPSELLRQFKQLYDQLEYTDAVCKVGTEKIKAHRAILSGHSPELQKVFEGNKTQEEFEFTGISGAAFKSALKFIYYGDINVDPLPACELISFATTYHLNDLKVVCEEKIKDSIAVNTVLEILAVTFLPHMATRADMNELKEKCVGFILEKLGDIELSALRKLHPGIAIDILFALQSREKGNPIAERPKVGLNAFMPSAPTQDTSAQNASTSSVAAQPNQSAPSPRSEPPKPAAAEPSGSKVTNKKDEKKNKKDEKKSKKEDKKKATKKK